MEAISEYGTIAPSLAWVVEGFLAPTLLSLAVPVDLALRTPMPSAAERRRPFGTLVI